MILVWVDPKREVNEATARLLREQGTWVIFLRNSDEAKDFLSAYEEKAASLRAKIRLVSNRTRPIDGGEVAGEELGKWFKASPVWKANPFLLFCGEPDKVKGIRHDPFHGLFVTSDMQVLLAFGVEKDLLSS